MICGLFYLDLFCGLLLCSEFEQACKSVRGPLRTLVVFYICHRRGSLSETPKFGPRSLQNSRQRALDCSGLARRYRWIAASAARWSSTFYPRSCLIVFSSTVQVGSEFRMAKLLYQRVLCRNHLKAISSRVALGQPCSKSPAIASDCHQGICWQSVSGHTLLTYLPRFLLPWPVNSKAKYLISTHYSVMFQTFSLLCYSF